MRPMETGSCERYERTRLKIDQEQEGEEELEGNAETVKTREREQISFGFQETPVENQETGQSDDEHEYYEQADQEDQIGEYEDHLDQYDGEGQENSDHSALSQDEAQSSDPDLGQQENEENEGNEENEEEDLQINTENPFYGEPNQNNSKQEHQFPQTTTCHNQPEPQITQIQTEYNLEQQKSRHTQPDTNIPTYNAPNQSTETGNLQSAVTRKDENTLNGNQENLHTDSGGILRADSLTPQMRRALLNERKGICCGVGTRKFRPPGEAGPSTRVFQKGPSETEHSRFSSSKPVEIQINRKPQII